MSTEVIVLEGVNRGYQINGSGEEDYFLLKELTITKKPDNDFIFLIGFFEGRIVLAFGIYLFVSGIV